MLLSTTHEPLALWDWVSVKPSNRVSTNGDKSVLWSFLATTWQGKNVEQGVTDDMVIKLNLALLPSVVFLFWGSRVGLGEQGWCSGKRARLPPMCPGFDARTRRHMWVEFVVGSLLCSERFFSGNSGFPPLLKNQHLIWFDLFDLQSPQLVQHSCSARMIWDSNKVIIYYDLRLK